MLSLDRQCNFFRCIFLGFVSNPKAANSRCLRPCHGPRGPLPNFLAVCVLVSAFFRVHNEQQAISATSKAPGETLQTGGSSCDVGVGSPSALGGGSLRDGRSETACSTPQL